MQTTHRPWGYIPMQLPQRQWRYSWGTGKITLTDKQLRIRYPARNEAVNLSEITSVNRTGLWPMYTLVIKHRGGIFRISALGPKKSREIMEALGF